MAYYAFFDPTDYITSSPTAILSASAMFGSDGAGGAPELALDTQQASDNGHVLWDGDYSDGVDSDYVSFSLDANFDTGSASFAAGGDLLSLTTGTGATIGSILVRTGASVPGSAGLSGLSFNFYKDGVFQESLSVPGDVFADASANESYAAEQVVKITPGGSGFDRVVVSGNIRLQAWPEVYPGWTDLFAQIAITA